MKVKINLKQRTVRHWNGQKRAQFPFMTLKRAWTPFGGHFPYGIRISNSRVWKIEQESYKKGV